MQPLSLDNLIDIVQGRLFGELPSKKVRSVSLDTRTLESGDLFWAIRGERHDGHQFLSAAQKKGAVAAVVTQPVKSLDLPQVIVNDTTAALGQFAQWHREQQPGMVIGVTGSVGKTTTRHMIHSVLSGKFSGTQSQSNFNNEIGVPLSLLDMTPRHEFAAIELAASAPGEICALSKMCHPEVAVITSIAESHLASFGSLETILSSKAELLESLAPAGFAVLNGDDPRLLKLSEQLDCPVFLFGHGAQNHFQAEAIGREADGWSFKVNGETFFLPVVSRAMISTAACAIAIASEFGMEIEEIRAGLKRFSPMPGRTEIKTAGEWTLIDDTYNASPLSMRAACRVLADWPGTVRKVILVGDMLELGEQSARFHQELGESVADSKIDFLIAHGEFSQEVVTAARRAGTPTHQIADCSSPEAIELVLDCWLQPGDVVLVKGSRGMRMERFIQWLQHRAAMLEQETENKQVRPQRTAA